VLERANIEVKRVGSGLVPKDPSHAGLEDGMVLELGSLEAGESATFTFTLTLDGRKFLNASQRARVVFYLDFSATAEGERPLSPTPTPVPVESAEPDRPLEGIPTATPTSPPSGHRDILSPSPSPSPTPTSAPEEEELPEETPPAGSIGDPDSIIAEGEAADPIINKRDMPKTGDARMRFYSILLLIALLIAYFMLRKKKERKNQSGNN
jgi:LPXTG-motif cell wall-anchored protein